MNTNSFSAVSACCNFTGFISLALVSSDFSICKIISSVNRDNLTACFSNWRLFFCLFPRSSSQHFSTVMTRDSCCGQCRLLLDLRGKTSNFSLLRSALIRCILSVCSTLFWKAWVKSLCSWCYPLWSPHCALNFQNCKLSEPFLLYKVVGVGFFATAM